MRWKSASHVLEHFHPSPQHCLRGEGGAVCLKNYNEVENINMQPMDTCCSNYFWRALNVLLANTVLGQVSVIANDIFFMKN